MEVKTNIGTGFHLCVRINFERVGGVRFTYKNSMSQLICIWRFLTLIEHNDGIKFRLTFIMYT